MNLRNLLLIIPAITTSLSFGQLSGTYTVGGNTPDYATLTDAVDDLLLLGASGDVVLDLRPGTYTGQYHITSIPGTPGVITIKGESDNADDVLLKYEATGAADNYIIEIEQQRNINLRALTLGTLSLDHARAVHFFDNCDGLNISNCVFIGSTATGGANVGDRILVQSDQSEQAGAANSDFISLTDNTFRAGSKAVDLDFQITDGRSDGLNITGNSFTDQTTGGISVSNARGRILDNRITTTGAFRYVGLQASNFADSIQILGNVIDVSATNSCTGLKFGNTPGTSGNLVGNNMISARGPDDVRGVELYDLKGTQLFHNTILVAEGPALQSIVLEHSGIASDAQDTELRNDLLVNLAGGPVLFAVIAGNLGIEDNNDLFTSGQPLADLEGVQYQDLAEYQAGSGQGEASFSIDPAFPFLPDLHLATCALDGLCPPLASITDDIDGQARDLVAADPGADEYAPLSVSFLGDDVVIMDTDLPWSLNGSQFASYLWNTGETTSSILISTAGEYSCVVTDVNGCSLEDTIFVQVEINTGMAVGELIRPVSFPNPADGQFTLNSPVVDITNVTLIDASGRIARQWPRSSVYSLTGIPAGSYIVVAQATNGAVIHDRLIVE